MGIQHFKMTNEKFTLTWHSYASHFQEFLSNLFVSGESSDVTLVCDDQVKFKAHKFVLKACSPVFESILQETNELKTVVYLRGVNELELKPILEFIYCGQASFYQERMKEFLKVGKDLQVKEIEEVPEADENKVVEENIEGDTHQEIIDEETYSDDIDSVDEPEIGSSATEETDQQVSVPSNSTQCPQCDAVFTQRHNMLAHIRCIHEGLKFPCSHCDYKATKQSHLKKHIESIHEVLKYPCSLCNFKASQKHCLKRHIESIHEGVKYPCSLCEVEISSQSYLIRHMKMKHGQ